ncbi:DUF202 domain-containing protein [Microbacterium sp. NPDC056044]|uniref:DUF202 domain-containing protein n=1 Tax=Microbacterium sp. NPDC056044 TaxID=3345690 RepID=UPI0035E32C7B
MSAPRSERPFDAGLQLERTALAWRRTGLALAVGALLAVRVLPGHFGAWVLIPAGSGLVLSVVVAAHAQLRYLAVHRRLTSSVEDDRIPLLDGRLLIFVTASMLTVGASLLAAVLITAL